MAVGSLSWVVAAATGQRGGEMQHMGGFRPSALGVARRASRFREDLVSVAVDAGLVALTLAAALLLHFNGSVPGNYRAAAFEALPVVIAAVLLANWYAGLYAQVWRHASIVEARRHVLGAAAAYLVLLAVDVWHRSLPWPTVVTAWFLYTGAAGLVRFQARLLATRRGGNQQAGVTRVLLVGAGDAGAALLRDMRRPGSNLTAVGLLDDDPRTHGRRIGGAPVLGPVETLPQAARRVGADQVLLAVPTADQALVRRVADLSEDARLPLRVLPPVHDLAGGRVGLRDVRDVDIEDLLGRAQVDTDIDAVRGLVAGKVVLVTGAGGSIGSEICRQVAALGPRELLLLDHDETHLFDVAATLPPGATQILADIRDRARINGIFGDHRPEVVFHAAAHKHVPLLEAHPAEAVRTNVTGTDAVVRAAVASGTERLVFISTDKAVAPSSIMGASKRIGEHLVLAAQPQGQAFCAVRFGNVLGSRGSVVPTFLEQIKHGGPVTVTDGRMTRYFMSIPEAVQLVLQAAALSHGGEIFMLDMGPSVSIQSLAERLIRLSGLRPGVDIEVRVTGIRPGEKLHESLHETSEEVRPTTHPSVLELTPTSPPIGVLRRAVSSLMLLTDHGRSDEARQLLVDLAHGVADKHEAGLLRLAHRRRTEDRGILSGPRDPGVPRRRLSDVVATAVPPSQGEPSEGSPVDQTERVPAWTSSTT